MAGGAAERSASAPSERTRVRRLPKRGVYDREEVYAILDAGLLCHVGYVVDGQAYVAPTAHWREGDHLYWHGSSASRMLHTQGAGVPVCVTVSLLDGVVLARSGFHHSMNYRSAMALGTAEVVEGAAAKLAALQAFSERVAPGRWREVRPPTEQELKATTIVRLPLDEASAKVRTGPPVDDEADYALPCWAGVVPVATRVGTPQPDPRLPAGTPAPAYLGAVRLG